MSPLSTSPRIAGVDVGTKRVGIALSDPLHFFATTHGTYSPNEALNALANLHASEGLEAVVVGWPLTEEGEEGEATEFVEAYLNRIAERLPNVERIKQDERYTSEWAKNALRRAGVKQPGRYDKGRVDAAAAAIILQLYLDTAC